MLATFIPLDVVDVLLWMLISALIGVCLYAVLTAPRQNRDSSPTTDTSPDRSDSTRSDSDRSSPHRPGPLDARGWTLHVDASVFARRNDIEDHAKLKPLDAVLDRLRHQFDGAEIVVYCDANLGHLFDDPDQRQFEQRLKTPAYRETHGQKADWPMLKDAKKKPRCIVVSNDKFDEEPEAALRIGVPLLKIRFTRGRVRLSSAAEVYENRWRKRNVPIEELVRSRPAT